VEQRMAKLEQKLDDHIKANQEAAIRDHAAHVRIESKLDEAMVFQHKVRWTIGVASTMLGMILMFIYHYLPEIWDALPKHGHTH